MTVLLGPLYLVVWAGLSALRAVTLRRGWQWQWRGGARGRHRLEFTGWALVWEWRLLGGLQRSRSSLLPSTTAARGRKHQQQQHQHQQQGDGPTLSVVLFWLGQAAAVLFLAWNAVATLHDSRVVAAATAAAAGPPEHRRLAALGGAELQVPSRMRPMAFLLPSSSGGGEEGTADWRYVWCAALLALAVHEYGHARAAHREGVPVQHAGVYLAVLLPGAFVLIPDTIKGLNPWARLRVLSAGVAANAALCLALALLATADLPSRLVATPEPGGGAVVRALPPQSPLAAVMAPGDGIAALQDVPITEGAAELVALLGAHAETTRARHASLIHAAGGAGEGGTTLLSLAALNATVTRLVDEARLPGLEEAGLLPPEALCTHLDLTDGEDEEDEDQPVPSCCSFDALVGRSHASASGPYTAGSAAATSCFAYLPLGKEEKDGGRGDRLHLTCLPARELALHSHVVGLGAAGSAAGRGDRGRPFCFRAVAVPPNVLLKITLAHGRVVTFEGRVDGVANAAVAAGLADTRPRPWVRALLPARGAMAVDAILTKLSLALVDVSFSLGALNLLPLYQLDGAHVLHEAVLLALARRGGPGVAGQHHKLLVWYRRGVLAVGGLFGLNVLLACLAAAGGRG